MNRAPAVAACSVLAGVIASGCSPAWHVLHASGPPSALRGAAVFAVSADFSLLPADTSREHARRVHAGLLKSMRKRAPGRVVPAKEADAYFDVTFVRVHYIEMSGSLWGRNPHVRARVTFKRGKTTWHDEIEIDSESSTALGRCGPELGAKISKFLDAAVH